MTALYALPDHEVVTALIPRIGQTHLGVEEAIERIRATGGMIPVAIDPDGGTNGAGSVMWADIGDYPFREWQFLYTIRTLAENGGIGDAFSTDLAILQDDRIGGDGIEPNGFIFHISRCGSTLTGKALARSPRHLVINQGGPLQRGFWAAITRDWRQAADPSPENLRALRNLVLAMTRQRRPEQDRAFIKFISWNTLYMDFVLAAFPGVPAIFLYRDPVEVIASIMRETTAILWAKGKRQAGFLTGADWHSTVEMGDVAYLAHCFAHYLEFADCPSRRVALVNYHQINPGNFAIILQQGLNFHPDPAELALMLEQFQYHSKDDSDQQKFRSDSAAKRASMGDQDKQIVAQSCNHLMQHLDQAEANLFGPAQSTA